MCNVIALDFHRVNSILRADLVPPVTLRKGLPRYTAISTEWRVRAPDEILPISRKTSTRMEFFFAAAIVGDEDGRTRIKEMGVAPVRWNSDSS